MNNHNRSWTEDIIRVLWNVHGSLHRNQLVQSLRKMRSDPPEAFAETVQSALNSHTRGYAEWKKKGSHPEDDLFYSPRTGEWVLQKPQAIAWLKARALWARKANGLWFPDLEAPWALDVAGDMVRETIKTKSLDLNEWPEDRITEAAKGLLDHFKAKKAKEHA